jgi:hypothetical protein
MSYRLESEAPQTTIERTIENILTNNGIKQDEIQFRGTERYLRIGYWQRINEDIMSQLSGLVTTEIDMYDDDCGYLFSYEIKH